MNSEKSREQLDAFFASGKEGRYAKRSVILGYGENTDMAYWITSGRVTVVSCTAEGIERIHHIYEAKELFPVKPIFSKEQFDVAFFAFTDVTVRVKPAHEFMKFLEQQPESMLAIINQQLAVFEGLIDLNYETAEQRIAFRLYTFARRFCSCEHKHPMVNCPITVHELASSVRVSRETTGKILNKFEKRGFVELQRQNIIAYPDKLKQHLEDIV